VTAVSTLDEVSVEFERQADASLVLVLFGRPLEIKK
jgi:hypothetical protein